MDSSIFITGGLGFIGSNIAKRLVELKYDNIIIYDNFSTGKEKFLYPYQNKIKVIMGDIRDTENLAWQMKKHNCFYVFHMAANADVRNGFNNPKKDLDNNIIGTHSVLEAMRINNVKRIFFPSTGSVYGNTKTIPTKEDTPLENQTSLYSASKLSGEALIQAYCSGYGFNAIIARFVSILGENYQHGFVYDFYKKLKNEPGKLDVLGDGTTTKSYLYVQDCVDAIFLLVNYITSPGTHIYNLGTNQALTVQQCARTVVDHLGLKNCQINYENKKTGWVGDNPLIYLSAEKIWSQFGWKPKVTIKDAIKKTLDYLKNNEWLFEEIE